MEPVESKSEIPFKNPKEIPFKILIVAPHSYCDNQIEQRHCDRRAKNMALRLGQLARETFESKSLKSGSPKSKISSFKVILSDKLRETHDYNRKSSYHTPWRRQVRDFIESTSDPIIVYEVHSFPKGTIFGEKSHMAIMSDRHYIGSAKKLHKKIADAGFAIHPKIYGSPVNNLMIDTAKYPHVKQHYLLEFNEEDGTDEQMDKLSSFVFASSLGVHRVIASSKVSCFLVVFVLCMIFILLVFLEQKLRPYVLSDPQRKAPKTMESFRISFRNRLVRTFRCAR